MKNFDVIKVTKIPGGKKTATVKAINRLSGDRKFVIDGSFEVSCSQIFNSLIEGSNLTLKSYNGKECIWISNDSLKRINDTMIPNDTSLDFNMTKLAG